MSFKEDFEVFVEKPTNAKTASEFVEQVSFLVRMGQKAKQEISPIFHGLAWYENELQSHPGHTGAELALGYWLEFAEPRRVEEVRQLKELFPGVFNVVPLPIKVEGSERGLEKYLAEN